MKHILTILLLFFSCVAVGQNKDAFEVNGNIFDSNEQALPGVLVTLKSDSLELKAVTDSKGYYSLKYKSTKPCTITFFKEGYKQSGGTFQPQPVTTISVLLETDEKVINLKEVNIEETVLWQWAIRRRIFQTRNSAMRATMALTCFSGLAYRSWT